MPLTISFIIQIIIILILVGAIFILTRSRLKNFSIKCLQQKKEFDSLKTQINCSEERLCEITARCQEIQNQIQNLIEEKLNLDTVLSNKKQELEICTERLNQLNIELNNLDKELITKRSQIDIDLAHEIEIKRQGFKEKLDKEFENLKNDSAWMELQAELDALKNSIIIGQKTLSIVEQKVADQVSKDEFEKTHSIILSQSDIEDVHTLFNMVTVIHRPIVFRKIIWSEYYQKPLQQLRKSLGADKIRGIYRIANKRTGQCYIGQSVDIGNRWTEHFKEAIMGTLNASTSKFYRALAEEGFENFTYEILEQVEDRSQLDERERYWINFYNSKENGYNSKIGG